MRVRDTLSMASWSTKVSCSPLLSSPFLSMSSSSVVVKNTSDVTARLLKELLGIQQRRAVAYNTLDRAFRSLLAGECSTPFYAQACRTVTEEFSDCSDCAKAIASQLETADNVELVELVNQIQVNERDKLQITVKLQALKKRYSETCQHNGNCQCEQRELDEKDAIFTPDVLYNSAVGNLLRRLQAVTTKINESIEQVQGELVEYADMGEE